MKFKTLIITFNIVLFILIFTVFAMPFFIYDKVLYNIVWEKQRIFLPFFLVLIAVVNIIFFKTRIYLAYMERRDVNGLCNYLKKQIFEKKKLKFKQIKLLSETLIMLSDFEALGRLETLLREKKPSYLAKLASKFIAGKMLEGKYTELNAFCFELTSVSANYGSWIRFYEAFSLYMANDFKKGAEKFKQIAIVEKNPLVFLLSAFLLTQVIPDYAHLQNEEKEKIFEKIEENIKAKYTSESWQSYIKAEEKEISILILTKLIVNASNWVFR